VQIGDKRPHQPRFADARRQCETEQHKIPLEEPAEPKEDPGEGEPVDGDETTDEGTTEEGTE